MTGAKGKSGGARPGAGRRPDLLTLGKQYLYWVEVGDKRTLLEVATVTEYDRDRGVIVLSLGDGSTVHLSRAKRRLRER